MRRALLPTALFLLLGIVLCANCAYAEAASPACTRQDLKALTDKFFTALEAHNAASLPLAANVKFTENGNELAVGKGFFETAGKPDLKRTLIDTQKCATHTEAVIEENGRPILYGVRLQTDSGKLSEIEMIIAREKEFAFNPKGVLETKDQDWETVLAPEQRSSRRAMIAAADDYFDMFAAEPYVRTPFNNPCDRWENGMQTTKGGTFQGKEYTPHDCSPKGLVITTHSPRRFLVDTDAGIVVAYVLFAGALPDFHMFKMRNGKVDLIQAVVGPQAKSMGWPIDPSCGGK